MVKFYADLLHFLLKRASGRCENGALEFESQLFDQAPQAVLCSVKSRAVADKKDVKLRHDMVGSWVSAQRLKFKKLCGAKSSFQVFWVHVWKLKTN
jgi:hypothetical protein